MQAIRCLLPQSFDEERPLLHPRREIGRAEAQAWTIFCRGQITAKANPFFTWRYAIGLARHAGGKLTRPLAA